MKSSIRYSLLDAMKTLNNLTEQKYIEQISFNSKNYFYTQKEVIGTRGDDNYLNKYGPVYIGQCRELIADCIHILAACCWLDKDWDTLSAIFDLFYSIALDLLRVGMEEYYPQSQKLSHVASFLSVYLRPTETDWPLEAQKKRSYYFETLIENGFIKMIQHYTDVMLAEIPGKLIGPRLTALRNRLHSEPEIVNTITGYQKSMVMSVTILFTLIYYISTFVSSQQSLFYFEKFLEFDVKPGKGKELNYETMTYLQSRVTKGLIGRPIVLFQKPLYTQFLIAKEYEKKNIHIGFLPSTWKKLLPELATSAKSDGNAYYQTEDYFEAREFYTCAIQLGSEDYKELYVLYSNRSQVEIQTLNWKKAEEDVLMALKLSPDHLKSLQRLELVRKNLPSVPSPPPSQPLPTPTPSTTNTVVTTTTNTSNSSNSNSGEYLYANLPFECVKTIFEYVIASSSSSPKGLATWNLVCKQWNTFAKRFLTRVSCTELYAQFLISYYQNLTDLTVAQAEDTPSGSQKLYKALLEATSLQKLSSLTLENYDPRILWENSVSKMSTLTSLDIRQSFKFQHLQSTEFASRTMSVTNLTNLQSVFVRNVPVTLKTLPESVQTLTVQHMGLSAASIPLKLVSMTNLRHLTFMGAYSVDAGKLVPENARLTSLAILNECENAAELTRLTGLKSLTLSRCDTTAFLSQMTCLEALKVDDIPLKHFQNLKLKKLTLSGHSPELLSGLVRLSSLQKLILRGELEKSHILLLSQLSSVTKLSIEVPHLHKEIVNFKNMNLQKLKLEAHKLPQELVEILTQLKLKHLKLKLYEYDAPVVSKKRLKAVISTLSNNIPVFEFYMNDELYAVSRQ
jgi:tetratricopeptide (TPR) repeat protein